MGSGEHPGAARAHVQAAYTGETRRQGGEGSRGGRREAVRGLQPKRRQHRGAAEPPAAPGASESTPESLHALKTSPDGGEQIGLWALKSMVVSVVSAT